MKLHFNPDGSFDVDAEPEEAVKFIQLKNGSNGNSTNNKKMIFLQKAFIEVLECFKNFPEGLTSGEVASLTGGMPEGTASSRCNRLAKAGLIVRRSGHWGYIIAPDIHCYDVREISGKPSVV